MPVPKAAVHQYDGFVFWKNDIGLAGEVFVMKRVSVSEAMQVAAHQHFRCRVLPFDPAHIVTAGLFAVYVCHSKVQLSGKGGLNINLNWDYRDSIL